MVYFIATPIGNLEDITVRALKILRKTNTIICEDTRHTSVLLNKYNIKNKQLISYNDYNKELKIDNLILTAKNEDVSFVSDAGMPIISDVGYKFLQKLIINCIDYTVIPGPSASLSALCLSALKPDKFLFLGFLPKNKSGIISILQSYKYTNATFIIFENKNRVLNTLNLIHDVLGNRNAAIVREITKIYEEIISGKVKDIIEKVKIKQIKGEIVILLENFSSINDDIISTQQLNDYIIALKKFHFSNKDIKNILKIFYKQKINYNKIII